MRNVPANSLWSLASITVALLIPSCSGHQTTNSDMQGTWVPEKTSQKWIKAQGGSGKCQIALELDGTFSATVPDYLMRTSDQCSGQNMAGRGRWSLSTKLLQTEVKLSFTEVDGKKIYWGATPLKVQTNGKSFVLFFYVGEEGGDRFIFERAPDQKQTQSVPNKPD